MFLLLTTNQGTQKIIRGMSNHREQEFGLHIFKVSDHYMLFSYLNEIFHLQYHFRVRAEISVYRGTVLLVLNMIVIVIIT